MFTRAGRFAVIRGGFHFRDKIFNPVHTGRYTVYRFEMNGSMKEDGFISYTGIYILGDFEGSFVFIGGGFDL